MLFIAEQTWHDLQSNIVNPVLYEEFKNMAYKLIESDIDVLLVNEEKQVVGKFVIENREVVLKQNNI